MGYIKGPKVVDFIIQSKPLTDKDRTEISKFIKDYKAKHSRKKSKIKPSSSKQRTLA